MYLRDIPHNDAIAIFNDWEMTIPYDPGTSPLLDTIKNTLAELIYNYWYNDVLVGVDYNIDLNEWKRWAKMNMQRIMIWQQIWIGMIGKYILSSKLAFGAPIDAPYWKDRHTWGKDDVGHTTQTTSSNQSDNQGENFHNDTPQNRIDDIMNYLSDYNKSLARNISSYQQGTGADTHDEFDNMDKTGGATTKVINLVSLIKTLLDKNENIFDKIIKELNCLFKQTYSTIPYEESVGITHAI